MNLKVQQVWPKSQSDIWKVLVCKSSAPRAKNMLSARPMSLRRGRSARSSPELCLPAAFRDRKPTKPIKKVVARAIGVGVAR